MTINFNFTLDDIDSENFARILCDHILDYKMKIAFYKAGIKDDIKDDRTCKWYESHHEYLEEMYATIMKGQTRLPA